MSEDDTNGHELVEDGGDLRDAKTGQFVNGHQKLGGRKKGAMDLMSICRRAAKGAGVKLEDMVWAVMRGLALKGAQGDAAAGGIVLNRLCGVQDRNLVELNVDQRSVHITAETRTALREILGGADVQAALLDDLERRTLEDDDE